MQYNEGTRAEVLTRRTSAREEETGTLACATPPLVYLLRGEGREKNPAMDVISGQRCEQFLSSSAGAANGSQFIERDGKRK